MRNLDAIAQALFGRAGAIADVVRTLPPTQEYGVTVLDDGRAYTTHTITIDPNDDALTLVILEFDALLALKLADDGYDGGCVTLWFESNPEATGKTIAAEIADWVRQERAQRTCVRCGCTDTTACLGVCAWASQGLCSRCVTRAEEVA